MMIRGLKFFSNFTKVSKTNHDLAGRISARHFELRRMPVACPQCAWRGTGADLSPGERHNGTRMTDYNCPGCGERIAAALWPTPNECRDNWNDLSAAEREYVSLLEQLAEIEGGKAVGQATRQAP